MALRSAKIVYKAFVIDDKSTDNTLKILKKLEDKYPIATHTKKGKLGKAYSILEGVSYCRGEVVAMLDGDVQYPPEKLPDMLKLLTGDVGVVVAKRVSRDTSMFRSVVSKINHDPGG